MSENSVCRPSFHEGMEFSPDCGPPDGGSIRVTFGRSGVDMENLVEQGLLYDYYGTLLTPHQQEIYEMAVYQDLSLNEIAEQNGVSRQAVSDLIRRVSAQLESYEQRLGLVERSRRLRHSCDDLDAVALRLSAAGAAEAEAVRQCADSIRREL